MVFEFHPAETEEHFEAPYISTMPYLFTGLKEAFIIGGLVVMVITLFLAPTLYEVIKNAR